MKKLFYMAILALLFSACGQSGTPAADDSKAIAASAIQTTEFKVKGMTCEGCENGVKESVGKVAGVSEVMASFKEEKAVVKFDTTKANVALISEAIKSAGYEVISSNTKK